MEERSAIDGYRNTPHSQSVDNFRRVDGSNMVMPSSSSSQIKAGIPNSTSYPNSLRSPTTGNGSGHYGSPESFQTNHIRKTLPNDYKPNGYTSKTSGTGSANSTLTRPAGRPAAGTKTSSQTGTGPSTLMEPDRTPRSLETKPNVDYRLSRSIDTRPDQRSSRMYESRSADRGMSRSLDRRKVGAERFNGVPDRLLYIIDCWLCELCNLDFIWSLYTVTCTCIYKF